MAAVGAWNCWHENAARSDRHAVSESICVEDTDGHRRDAVC